MIVAIILHSFGPNKEIEVENGITEITRTQGLIEKHNDSLKNIYLNKKHGRLDEVLPEIYSLHISLQRQFEITKTRRKQDERFFTLSTEKFKKTIKNPGQGIYQHPRKVKSFKLEDLPEEWKNLTLMKWGGKVNCSVQHLPN